MESETLRPDANHTPPVQQDDAHRHGVEHGFRRQVVAFLDVPEGEDADGLRDDANDEEVGEL